MSAGMWGATLFVFLAGAAISWLWIITKPEPEDPPGITITYFKELGWNYVCDDPRAMHGLSTGYLTRRSALRAAQAELNRLERKDQTTR